MHADPDGELREGDQVVMREIFMLWEWQLVLGAWKDAFRERAKIRDASYWRTYQRYLGTFTSSTRNETDLDSFMNMSLVVLLQAM